MQASRAIRIRFSTLSPAVIARNSGTVAIGSMTTNSELNARRTNSETLTGLGLRALRRSGGKSSCGDRARRQCGVSHTVDDLFIRRTDRGEHAAEVCARAIRRPMDKIEGTKPDPPRH